MCLYVNTNLHHKEYNKTSHRSEIKPLLLKEKMLVYKIIYQNDQSQYRDFKYSPKQTYKVNKIRANMDKRFGNFVEKGFHAYVDFKTAKSLVNYRFMKIVAFYIPKGATVFFGEGGDIVSNEIISGDLKSLKRAIRLKP